MVCEAQQLPGIARTSSACRIDKVELQEKAITDETLREGQSRCKLTEAVSVCMIVRDSMKETNNSRGVMLFHTNLARLPLSEHILASPIDSKSHDDFRKYPYPASILQCCSLTRIIELSITGAALGSSTLLGASRNPHMVP